MLRLRQVHHLAMLAAAAFVAAAFIALVVIIVGRTTALREQLGRAESAVKQLQSDLRKQQETQDRRLDGLERRGKRETANAAGGKRDSGGEAVGVRPGKQP